MALQAGGVGAGAAMMNAPMQIPGGGLMPQQTMPRFSTGPSSSSMPSHSTGQLGPIGDPRAAVEVDEEAMHGGDACLCVEFGGDTLCAAAWDATKKSVVALSVGDKGETVTSTNLGIKDSTKLKAWLSKPAKTRAAEAHTAGVDIGKDQDNMWATVKTPGYLIGPVGDNTQELTKYVSGQLDITAVPSKKKNDDDDTDDFGLSEYGQRLLLSSAELGQVEPEAFLALLAARPRQRATQLVSKPVRRMTIVGPASATMAWRLAVAEGPRFVDARCSRFISAPLAQIVGAALRIKKSFTQGDKVISAIIPQTGSMVDAVIATCQAAPIWFSVIKVISSQNELQAILNKEQNCCFILRGDAPHHRESIVTVQAQVGDAVAGAATLAAARLGLPGAPIFNSEQEMTRDALPYQIILKTETGNQEILFEAGTPLPASCRREYCAADFGGGPKKTGTT
mmetsp:Transcript_19133/g.23573  ORF Transcript_19133/g.23573 Transcript_19133/m.23573 type:complete len:452 (+) Transcript_19133:36-1391(+)